MHMHECKSVSCISVFICEPILFPAVCVLLSVCWSLRCCCLHADRQKLPKQRRGKLSDVLSYACGNESCWHTELWPLRHKDIQHESLQTQRRLEIGVPSFFPNTLLPFYCTSEYLWVNLCNSLSIFPFAFFSFLFFSVRLSLPCTKTLNRQNRQWESSSSSVHCQFMRLHSDRNEGR